MAVAVATATLAPALVLLGAATPRAATGRRPAQGMGQSGAAMMPAAGALPAAMHPGHTQQQQQLRVVELPAGTNPGHIQQHQQKRVVELPQMTPKLPADPASRSAGSELSLSLMGSGAPLVLAGGAPRPGIQQDPAHMPPMNRVACGPSLLS